jgi:hypothetical protein
MHAAAASAAWGEPLERAAGALRQKAELRKATALEDQWLLPTERSQRLTATLAALKDRRDKNDQAASRKEARLAAAGSDTKPVLQQARVYVHKDCTMACMVHVRRHGMELVHPAHAPYVVVQDPATPSTHCKWACVLRGGTLVTPGFLCDGSGPAVAYLPAVTSRRRVWVSAAFQSAHPVLLDILRKSAAGPGSHWKLLLSGASPQAAQGFGLVGLVTKQEKGTQEIGSECQSTCMTWLSAGGVVHACIPCVGCIACPGSAAGMALQAARLPC